MFKATLSAALLVGTTTASVTSKQQDAIKTIAEMQQKVHAIGQTLKHPSVVHASGAATVQSRGIATRSNKASVRTLRGKGGKGKGKGRGKDDDKDEDEEEVVVVPRSFLQFQAGFCAGTDPWGEGVFTEDNYVTTLQIANNVCINGVDPTDSYYYSFMHSFSLTTDAVPLLVHTIKDYAMHDCVAENLNHEESGGDFLTFGGVIPTSGACTPISAGSPFSARVLLTETSLTHADVIEGRAVTVEAGSIDINTCQAALLAQDLSAYDFLEVEQVGITFPTGYQALCYTKDSGGGSDDGGDDGVDDGSDDGGDDGVDDGSDDGGDDTDDWVAVGGSYKYDVSRCGEATPMLTRTRYTSDDCSSVVDATETNSADLCVLEAGNDDVLYGVNTCFSNV